MFIKRLRESSGQWLSERARARRRRALSNREKPVEQALFGQKKHSFVCMVIYIYILIELACGKVPLWAHRDGWVRRVRRPGCLVFSQGALLKVFSNRNGMLNRSLNDGMLKQP